MTRPTAFLALPHRDQAAKIPLGALKAGDRADVRLRPASRSILTHCFNVLWVAALNERPVDWFVMLHDDVLPADGWLDVLIGEAERTGADVVSAVVAIKDERGVSSTAVRDPDTGWLRRLTIRETDALPETFDAAAAGFPGQTLLVNTGCWACRFDRDWVEKIAFRQEDGIAPGGDGKFKATTISEDWLFSMDAAELGLKVMATRKVPTRHIGLYGFASWGPWGGWETDQEPSAPLMG